MSDLWDPQQREWLEAMGLQVWVRAGQEPAAAGRESVRAAGVAPGPLPAPDAVDRSRAGAVRTAHPASDLARALPDRLMRAVLRAAGRRPDEGPDPELAARVDTARLRGDPAAKRALWPYLRALRRGRRA